MLKFKELVKAYHEVDQRLADELSAYMLKKYHKKAEKIKQLRYFTDQAYFVLLFAQFEFQVNDKVQKLIKKKQKLATWQQKRAWLALNNDIERIAFRDRVSLLMDRGSHHYQKVIERYEQRNKLAHGTLNSFAISIPGFVNDIKTWSKELKI